MAEQKKNPAGAPGKDAKKEETKSEQPAKKGGLPMQTLAILGAAMLIEAIAIIGVYHFASGPQKVKADTAAEDVAAQAEQPVELELITEKFQNTRTGRTYIYDTEIFIVIREKDKAKVEEGIKRMAASVGTEVATIFRRAEPAHLLEPTLATLTRQIHAVLDERLGKDQDGKSMIQQVLIKKCTQFRVDI